MSTVQISLYSVTDLKNNTDDTIPVYLNSLKFNQSHYLSDVRLAIGYVAILIAAATFFWDYKYGFETTKVYTGFAVVIYTILNSILTIWVTFVEKRIIYVGTNCNGDRIQISSKSDKYVPVYNLTVTTCLRNQPEKLHTIVLKKSFSDWFNQAGYLVPSRLQHMLASNVPVIGAADPERVTLSNLLTEEKAAPSAESSGVDIVQGPNIRVSTSGKKRGHKA